MPSIIFCFWPIKTCYDIFSYQQELPTRFKKDIVKAATAHDDYIGIDNMQRVLANIGADQRLTKKDLELIFSEVGSNGEIPAKRFMQMIWGDPLLEFAPSCICFIHFRLSPHHKYVFGG